MGSVPPIEIPFVDGHADVWRLFDDPRRLRAIGDALVAPFRGRATKIAGIESRGFILGTVAALCLDVGFVPIRKAAGIFPGAKVTADAAIDYRGISNTLRLQRAALSPGDAVLLVDDWIETGNQARAAMHLIEACGAGLIGVATVVRQASPDAVQGLGRMHALVTAAELTREQQRP